MQNSTIKISVIIPAYNEEENIQQTLLALKKDNNLDIIVVDNGSTDRTAEIAKTEGVTVIQHLGGTIAEVRNRGVKESSAVIYIFIDADVVVSSSWHDKLPSVVAMLGEKPLIITGSRVKTSNNLDWINKYWYSELSNYKAPYINSGHLITTAELFHLVGGFSEHLKTAEDYDFCQKARHAGAEIRDNPDLYVVHEGYPESISGLIRRECWHGGQDVYDWNAFIESKIAWFAALNLLLLTVALSITLFGYYMAVIAYFIAMYFVSLLLTLYKFGMKPVDYLLIMPVFFYFYLCGRSLALVDRLLGRKSS